MRKLSVFLLAVVIVKCSLVAQAELGFLNTDKSDFELIGDVLQFVPVSIGYGISAYKKDKEGIKQLTKSTLVTFVFTRATKYAFNYTTWGTRPKGGKESFVSGHTSFACSGSAFLTSRYGHKYGLPTLGVSLVVAASRIQAKRHHLRDVVAGCALSYAVSQFVVTKWKDKVKYLVIGKNYIGFHREF